MASRVKDQAFPFLKPHEDVGTYIPGMTLRDYFAAKAMHALYTTMYEWEPTGYPRAPDARFMGELAVDAYQMADAMLEARK